MNMITGYLAPTKGDITVNSYDMLTQAEKARQCIGYLPEIPPLYPDMTVLEYLRFVSELKKVPKKERDEQIREIMRMVEITDVEERLIRNLSKGYKQRVGLAQAIIGYPDIIILDEPMVGLDPKQIIEIRELIKTLAGKQHTIILSSHILSEVSTLCDHIMIISHGRLVASDSPEGLQKLMVKSTEIEVIALGDSEKAEKILAEIEHIRSFSLEEAAEEGSVRMTIVADHDTDIRKEISVALTQGDMPVLSMHKIEKSLEDIFLELTEDGEEAEENEAEAGREVEEDDGDL